MYIFAALPGYRSVRRFKGDQSLAIYPGDSIHFSSLLAPNPSAPSATLTPDMALTPPGLLFRLPNDRVRKSLSFFTCAAALHGCESLERYPGRAEHDRRVPTHRTRPLAGTPRTPHHPRLRCRLVSYCHDVETPPKAGCRGSCTVRCTVGYTLNCAVVESAEKARETKNASERCGL